LIKDPGAKLEELRRSSLVEMESLVTAAQRAAAAAAEARERKEKGKGKEVVSSLPAPPGVRGRQAGVVFKDLDFSGRDADPPALTLDTSGHTSDGNGNKHESVGKDGIGNEDKSTAESHAVHISPISPKDVRNPAARQPLRHARGDVSDVPPRVERRFRPEDALDEIDSD
jgi:hypothetical protein